MVMTPYQIKFNYTAGNEFTLSGENYGGFFNVYSDETVYTGKYRTTASQQLVALSNFASDYHKSSHFKDLVTFNSYKLPHAVDDILISMGELVNFTTINTKIGYLHENLLYTYAKMFMGDTNVPVDYNRTAGISNTNLTAYDWHVSSNYNGFGKTTFAASSGVPELSAYTDMDNMKRMVIIPSPDNTNFSIFGITDTRLIGLTSDIGLSSIGITLYTDVIDEYSTEKCQNLSDLTYDGKYLYVTDSSINSGGQVFKYDITSYSKGDAAFENKRFLIRPVGGLGGKKDINKFNKCTIIGSKPGVILVADENNNTIKVFSRDLVWLKSIVLPFGDYQFLDIRHRPINDCFYFLTKNLDSNTYAMFVYDANYKYIETVMFEDVLYEEVDNTFNRMILSETDSNVFYLCTDSTLHKKYFSNPTKTFAVFKRDKFGQAPIFQWQFESLPWNNENKRWNQVQSLASIKLSDIAVLPIEAGYDSLFVLGKGIIYHFNETTRYVSSLRDDNIEYYNFNKIKLEQVENIQSTTINKEIYKMFSNIIQLKNLIMGRFSIEFNAYGDLEFQGYKYFIDSEIDSLNVELDFNSRINSNELVQSGTLNKIFTRIYNLLVALLNLTKPVVTNYKTVTTNKNVLLID